MPLSRVQQEKASVPQHSVSGVLCHLRSFKKPHLYCSFVTSPRSSAQAVSLGWREQAVSVEDSQAQGSSSRSVGLVLRSPCTAHANRESLGFLQFPLDSCKIGICQAAWLFHTGLTGRRGQGRADSSRSRSASARSSCFPAEPFPREEMRFDCKS